MEKPKQEVNVDLSNKLKLALNALKGIINDTSSELSFEGQSIKPQKDELNAMIDALMNNQYLAVVGDHCTNITTKFLQLVNKEMPPRGYDQEHVLNFKIVASDLKSYLKVIDDKCVNLEKMDQDLNIKVHTAINQVNFYLDSFPPTSPENQNVAQTFKSTLGKAKNFLPTIKTFADSDFGRNSEAVKENYQALTDTVALTHNNLELFYVANDQCVNLLNSATFKIDRITQTQYENGSTDTALYFSNYATGIVSLLNQASDACCCNKKSLKDTINELKAIKVLNKDAAPNCINTVNELYNFTDSLARPLVYDAQASKGSINKIAKLRDLLNTLKENCN